MFEGGLTLTLQKRARKTMSQERQELTKYLQLVEVVENGMVYKLKLSHMKEGTQYVPEHGPENRRMKMM